MDGDLLKVAITILFVVLIYAAVARGMFRATEPLRFEMLEIADQLLDDPKIPDPIKRGIERSLSEVHSASAAWWLFILMLCLTITAPLHRFRIPKGFNEGLPKDKKEALQRFRLFWIVSTIANSPLAAFGFTLLLVIVVAFSLSVARISSVLLVRHLPDGREEAHATIRSR